MRIRLCWLTTVLCVSLFVDPVSGQERETYSIVLQGVSLSEALAEVLKVAPVDIVYSNELVTGKLVFCREKDVSLEELLQCILSGTGIDYIRSSAGTYILLEAREIGPRFGSVGGGVFDAETGAPLPFANVLLADGSAGTTTNEDGLFTLASLVSGQQPMTVSYVGYKPAYDTVYVEVGNANKHAFYLEADEFKIDPIVINGLVQRMPSSMLGTGEQLKESLQSLQGGKTADAIQGASQLVGISIQQPVADLYIQGGAGNEHLTLLDGVIIRNPVSMGRHLGAFSPLALERLTVHKAGFEARYGSQLTGIVSAEQDLSTTTPVSGAIMIDPVSINGRFIGALKNDNGGEGVFMVAARKSNWGTYEDKDVRSLLTQWSDIDPLITSFLVRQPISVDAIRQLDHDVDVDFSDLHFASRFRFNPFHMTHASLYRAVNDLGSSQSVFHASSGDNAPFVLLSQNGYSWLNWGGQIRHSWLVGARSSLTTQVRGSWHESSLNYQAYFDEQDQPVLTDSLANYLEVFQDSLQANVRSSENNKIRELSIQINLFHSIAANHHIEMGLEGAHTDSRFSFFQPFVDPYYTHPSNWHWSGFVESTYSFGPRMVITPGLRVTYVPALSTVYAEPRLSWRLDGATSNLGNYAFRLSGGVYRQYVNQLELTGYGSQTIVPTAYFWLPLDGSYAPSRSYHLAFDAMLLPAQQWELRVEAYFKWLHRMLDYDHVRVQDLETEDDQNVLQSAFLTPANGRASGIGVSLGYNDDALAGNVAYEYSETKKQFPGRFEDRSITVPWNVPHRLRLHGEVRFAKNVQFESTWTQNWGRAWGLRRGYYDVFAIWDPNTELALPDLDSPTKDTLPIYQRLDIGLTYLWQNKEYSTRIQLFMLNVLDHDNVYDNNVEAQIETFRTIPRRLPGRQLTASIRFDF